MLTTLFNRNHTFLNIIKYGTESYHHDRESVFEVDIYIYIYIYIHICNTSHRTTNLKSQRSKMSVISMQSSKQCALSVINTVALWQLMH